MSDEMTTDVGTQTATPDLALGDGDALLTQAPIAMDDKVLGKTPPATAPTSQPRKTATILAIHDSTNTDDEQLTDAVYMRQVLKATEIRSFGSEQEFVAVLQQYESIDSLFIVAHGEPGVIMINGRNTDLERIPVLFSSVKPKIRRISLEGCEVGQRPDTMVVMGKFFGATEIAAWTWYWVPKPIKVIIEPNTTVEKLETSDEGPAKIWRHYKGYYMEGSPSAAELVKKPGTYTLYAEWFRSALDYSDLPPVGSDQRPDYRPRPAQGKLDRRVTCGQAKKLTAEYKAQVPVASFEHVVIDLTKD